MCRMISMIVSTAFAATTVCAEVEFSADLIMKTAAGEMAGKIFSRPDKLRMDFNQPQKMSTIILRDKHIVYAIMHDMRMYTETSAAHAKETPHVSEKVKGEIERKKIGTETIDGHPAVKYLITYENEGKRFQMHQWLASDIKFPLKSAAVDGSWSQEYRNLKMGPQDDILFEVPAGYKKMEIPSGMEGLMKP